VHPLVAAHRLAEAASRPGHRTRRADPPRRDGEPNGLSLSQLSERLALPYLQRLFDTLDETVDCAVLDGDHLRFIDQLGAPHRATQVAFDREEHTAGISAAGIAIRDPFGALAAISVPIPTQRFEGREAEIVDALTAPRRDIFSGLGVASNERRSSWRNLVERGFADPTTKQLRRATHRSIRNEPANHDTGQSPAPRGSKMLGASRSPASAWLTRCPPKIDGRKPTPLQPRL